MKIAFPSFSQIIDSLGRIAYRFPFVVTTSLLATIGALFFTEVSFNSTLVPDQPLKLWLVGGLGISVLFGLAIFTEQQAWGAIQKIGVQAAGFVLLVLYFFALGTDVEHHPAEVWFQFAVFGLAAHLFAAVAPFLKKGKLDEFWEYNKVLFLRFLLSALYSGVLFVGLVIALLSVSQLLEFDVKDQRYFQLFIILGGLFNTWFFMAGVPEKEAISSSLLEFPLGLRRFAQYVLIPLVTVYIVILYLYLGKIMVQWQLPNGWVANLVLTFSIAGILSLLLLYPIRESDENKWVRVYSRYYYLALLPLIGLLIFSIWVRISEYGVTINRYFVATLGIWLTGIVVYFILSKAKNIKVIPISLCLVAVGVSFGPLSAFSVSERSQLGRFEKILNEYGYLDENGKAQKSENEIPFEDRKELSSVADYVVENHGVGSLIEAGIISASEKERFVGASHFLRTLDIEYLNEWQEEDESIPSEIFFTYLSKANAVIDITEYEYVIDDLSFNASTKEVGVSRKGIELYITFDHTEQYLVIREHETNTDIRLPVDEFAHTLYEIYGQGRKLSHEISSSDMQIKQETDKMDVLVLFSSISGRMEEFPVNSIEVSIFIKIK